MPSVKQAVKADLSKYEKVDRPNLPVVVQMVTGNKPRANPQIRCPLPPFNADPDTLRQFETGTEMPTIRVIPLPEPTTQAPPTRTVATEEASTSSSSSSSTVTTLTPKSITISAPTIAPGDNFQTTAIMSRTFQLIQMSADVACEVRLYGNAAAQGFDASRALGDPVPAEIMPNLCTDVDFNELPFQWFFQNRVFVNADTPSATTAYVTIFNTSDVDSTGANIVIEYLPLEA